MKTEELRKLDVASLQKELTKARQAHFQAKFEVASGESNNTAKIKRNQKLVARIKTIINEKEKNEKSLEKSN